MVSDPARMAPLGLDPQRAVAQQDNLHLRGILPAPDCPFGLPSQDHPTAATSLPVPVPAIRGGSYARTGPTGPAR